jgi:hypothetical protein
MSGRPKHHEQSVVRDHKAPTRSPQKRDDALQTQGEAGERFFDALPL